MSTLCTDEDHGDLSCVPVAGQAQEIIVHRLEADFILQAEDENHSIDPGSELKMEQMQAASLSHGKLCATAIFVQPNMNVLCCAEQGAQSGENLYTHLLLL